MIYLIIFVYIFFLSFFYDYINLSVGKKTNQIILLFILIGLAGFRYKVGVDTYYYMIRFDALANLSELFPIHISEDKIQPLWLLLNAISKSIYPEFFVFQIIHALIINSIIFYFIQKYTKYFFTGILFYYMGSYGYFNFEILRESLAVCIFLLSIESFTKKHWIRYYLFAVFAVGFHLSAIILFVLPLMKKIPVDIFSIFFLIVLCLLLHSFASGYFNFIAGVGSFSAYIKNYSSYSYTFWGLIAILILNVFYPMFILKTSGSFLKITTPLYPFLRINILLGVAVIAFYICFRFLNYFVPIIYIFCAEIIHGSFKRKRIRKIAPVLVVVFFILFSWVNTAKYFSDTSDKVPSSRWYSHWYPYYSIFDKQEDPIREELRWK